MSPFQKHVAMDLGTANTLIYVKGEGVVLDEPSMVTLDEHTRKVIAAGSEARDFSGRHGGGYISCRPLKCGAIQDFEPASAMIKTFLRRAFRRVPMMRPKLVLVVPTGITTFERRALVEAARKAGAGKVYLLHDPIAAAIGAGLRVHEPRGHMLIDIGGGSTEVAVVCRDAIACSESLRIAGDEIDKAICHYVRRQFHIDISEMTAEQIKIKIGSAFPLPKERTAEFTGKDLSTGVPKVATVTDAEIRHAIRKPIAAIVEAVKRLLDKASPHLAVDICDNGISLTGGSSLLKGWRQLFYEESGLEVQVSHDPLRATIRGAGATVEQFEVFRDILMNGTMPSYAKAL